MCVSVCSVQAFHSHRLNEWEASDRNGNDHFTAALYHKQTLKDDKGETEKDQPAIPSVFQKDCCKDTIIALKVMLY